MGDVERVDRDRVLRIGVNDDQPILNVPELPDRVDQVALAVHQDQGSAQSFEILDDHGVQQCGLASAWRAQNPMARETRLLGHGERRVDVEELAQGSALPVVFRQPGPQFRKEPQLSDRRFKERIPQFLEQRLRVADQVTGGHGQRRLAVAHFQKFVLPDQELARKRVAEGAERAGQGGAEHGQGARGVVHLLRVDA